MNPGTVLKGNIIPLIRNEILSNTQRRFEELRFLEENVLKIYGVRFSIMYRFSRSTHGYEKIYNLSVNILCDLEIYVYILQQKFDFCNA